MKNLNDKPNTHCDTKEEVGNCDPIRELSIKISNKLDSDILLYAGEINRQGFDAVIKFCQEGKTKNNLILIIMTYGGDPHAGFRIARTLDKYFQKVSVMVPDMCKSAGTLVALGADELIIADRGELGPLDTQVRKPEELFDYSSGLDIVKAMQFLQAQALDAFRAFLLDMKLGGEITTKMSAEIATDLTAGLFAPIYGQIDPYRLGEWQRAINIAYDYGKRLQSKNLKSGALGKLVGGYSSHGFAIDREEAILLFRVVRPPDEEENALSNYLVEAISQQSMIEFKGLNHLNGGDDDEPGKNDHSATAAEGSGSGISGNVHSGDQLGKPRDTTGETNREPVTGSKGKAKSQKK